jgi:hypothetical protein
MRERRVEEKKEPNSITSFFNIISNGWKVITIYLQIK